MGLTKKHELLKIHFSAKNVFDALSSSLDPDKSCQNKAESIMFECQKKGIFLLPFNKICTRSDYSLPILLYCKGNMPPENTAVGIVGTRRCTPYGKKISAEIAEKYAQFHHTIISGMAKGVDSYAHTAAIKANGFTIAVLGNGPDICFPAEHARLMEEIVRTGLIVSEYPPGMRATAYTFPMRNRIIAALSDFIVVTESGIKGGAMITAEKALNYNVPVFSVPGNITSPESNGCNFLIASGRAKMFTYDILKNENQLSLSDIDPEFDKTNLVCKENPPYNQNKKINSKIHHCACNYNYNSDCDSDFSSGYAFQNNSEYDFRNKVLSLLKSHNNAVSFDALTEIFKLPMAELYDRLLPLELDDTIQIQGETIWLP